MTKTSNNKIKEVTDVYLSITNDLLTMTKIKGEILRRKDQISISDIYNLFSEIDYHIIDEILIQNKADKRVNDLLSGKKTKGYGGVTLFRIAKIIINNLDISQFDLDVMKDRINGKFTSVPFESFHREPRDNWSEPIFKEIGVEESHIFYPHIVVEILEDYILFKMLDTDTWEFVDVDLIASEEKLDSFIKAITEAREKVFGTPE